MASASPPPLPFARDRPPPVRNRHPAQPPTQADVRVLYECFGVLHILDWLVPQEVGRKVSPYGAVERCASLEHALPRREGVRERERPGNGRKAHLLRIRCLAISDDVANYGGQLEFFISTPLVASVLANFAALLFFWGVAAVCPLAPNTFGGSNRPPPPILLSASVEFS